MTLKILTIEDEPAITTFLDILLAMYDMKVIIANDGATGIEMARAQAPDLILLDLMMPVVDGWEVCRTIRSFSQVPIIVVTAVSSKEKLAAALAAGANTVMEKPVAVDELVSVIKKFTNT